MANSTKILMIIAHKDFRDEEYFIPRDLFLKAGMQVTTASSKTGMIPGFCGDEALATLSIKDVRAVDFDAMIFVGGNGAHEYFKDPQAHRVAQEFNASGKLTAAICIAPVILANAGVLRGRTATVWSSELDKTGPKALLGGGCELRQDAVVVSDNVITGRDRDSAQEFAETVIRKLSSDAGEH
jgi:protease I